MGNQLAEPAAQTARSTYQKAVFVSAFGILLLEAAILITATVWESYAPQWAKPILDEKGTLIGVAAAIALLLSLLWAWQPTGLARYATLSSGVLSFAAATYSLEPDDLSLGLALLALSLPLLVIMLPNLLSRDRSANWVSLLSTILFTTMASMFVMLGIKPVTEIAVTIGIRGPGGLVIAALSSGVLFTFGLIIIHLTIQLAVHFVRRWVWMNRVWGWITRRRRGNRAKQRRRQKQRR